MSEGSARTPRGEDRWDEALAWYVTLRDVGKGDLTDALGRQWLHWWADSENQRVFDAVSRLLADRGIYRKPRQPTKTELEDDRYDLAVPIAEWLSTQAPRESRKPRSLDRKWWWLSGGLAVAASLVLLFLSPLRPGFSVAPSNPVVYQTDIGKLRDVQLSDGSSIILGGRTVLSVGFSAQRRSVSLIEGQAWFRVAHNPHWPFVVAAGNGTVTAVGTAFVVTRDSNRVVVTVTEGAVEVSARPRTPPSQSPVAKPTLSPIRVSRGEELAFGDNGIPSSVKRTDSHAATAWTRGRLTFDDQPLRYVIETVDRYSSRHVVVSDSAGPLRFSGIVFEDKIEDWLQSLEVIFPVIVETRPMDVCIHMRHPTAAVAGPLSNTCP